MLYFFLKDIQPASKKENPKIELLVSDYRIWNEREALMEIFLTYLCGEGRFEVKVKDLKRKKEKTFHRIDIAEKRLIYLLECSLCSGKFTKECREVLENERDLLLLYALQSALAFCLLP